MTLLQSPIRQIAMIVAAAARATTSGSRLFEILDLEPLVADRRGRGTTSWSRPKACSGSNTSTSPTMPAAPTC